MHVDLNLLTIPLHMFPPFRYFLFILRHSTKKIPEKNSLTFTSPIFPLLSQLSNSTMSTSTIDYDSLNSLLKTEIPN